MHYFSLVLAVFISGCATSSYCEVDLKEKTDCSQFAGEASGACALHVSKHKIKHQ